MRTVLFFTLALLATAPDAAANPARTLSLDQALAQIDTQSLMLAEARNRVHEAEALVGQVSSQLLPTVVAAGGYVRNSDEAKVALGGLFQAMGREPPPGIPGTLYIQPVGAWSISGSVRVPLLTAQGWADRAAAKHGSEAALSSAAAVRAQVRAAFVQSSWMAAAAEGIVAASERAVATAKEHRETAARMVTAGQAAPLSVLKADTELVKRESDLVRVRAELERTQLALGVLMGTSEPVRVVMPAGPPAETTTSANSLTSEALAQRPELGSLDARLEANQSEALSARLRLLPQISGSATVFASDMPYPTGKKDGWRLTLDATWPIFDGGFRKAKRAQAEAAGEGVRLSAAATRVSIAQEVADAVRDIGVAAERVRLAERQVAFAGEAAASAKRTFEGGVAGSLEVLDANDRLYQAEVSLADARGRLGVAHTALAKAVGRDLGR
jgi:outer membrane protein TolC